MIRIEGNRIVYDIYESRSSLQAAVKGGEIDFKNTKHDETVGEFSTTWKPRASTMLGDVPRMPDDSGKDSSVRADICHACGRPFDAPAEVIG